MPKKKRTFLTICLKKSEREALDLAAAADFRPVSQWARRVLVEAAKKAVKP